MLKSWRLPAVVRGLACVVALSLAASPMAQVGQVGCPDGFAGPCCGPASPKLPQFPPVAWQDGKKICTIDCTFAQSQSGPLALSPPTPTGPCGVYSANLSGPLLGCAAPTGGTLTLYYTRKWLQVFPLLGPLHVYRFVAVGDLCVTPVAGSACHVELPPSRPFVFGHVDYAFRKVGPPPCNLQFVAAALALGHPCDRFVHDPACPFMADPLPPTHPLDQLIIVAPGSNFIPNPNMTPPQGGPLNLPREAVRRVQPGAVGTCEPNERVSSLQLQNVMQQCACVSPALVSGPYTRQSLTLATNCGTTIDTMPICPFSATPPPMVQPFPTLAAWSIGAWMPGQFPGVQGGNRFFLAQGSGLYQRPPTAVCPVINPQRSIYYGVENIWGNSPNNGGKRVDLVDNVDPVLGSTTVMPVVGGPGQLGTHVAFFF